jgi:hypothetical protein
MADSDEEYVGSVTDDEDDLQVTRTDQTQTRKRKQRGGAEWELARTWETLVEGADGTISSTVEGLLEASKRKRSESLSTSSSFTWFLNTDLLLALAGCSKTLRLYNEVSYDMSSLSLISHNPCPKRTSGQHDTF